MRNFEDHSAKIFVFALAVLFAASAGLAAGGSISGDVFETINSANHPVGNATVSLYNYTNSSTNAQFDVNASETFGQTNHTISFTSLTLIRPAGFPDNDNLTSAAASNTTLNSGTASIGTQQANTTQVTTQPTGSVAIVARSSNKTEVNSAPSGTPSTSAKNAPVNQTTITVSLGTSISAQTNSSLSKTTSPSPAASTSITAVTAAGLTRNTTPHAAPVTDISNQTNATSRTDSPSPAAGTAVAAQSATWTVSAASALSGGTAGAARSNNTYTSGNTTVITPATAESAKAADHRLADAATDTNEVTAGATSCGGTSYYTSITIDIDQSGVIDGSDAIVNIHACDMDNNGTLDPNNTISVGDFIDIDGDADALYEASNAHAQDETNISLHGPDGGLYQINMTLDTDTTDANVFTITVGSAIGNSIATSPADINITATTVYTGNFSLMDGDADGVIGTTNNVTYVVLDLDSDNIYDAFDIDLNGNEAFANDAASHLDETNVANDTVVTIGSVNYTLILLDPNPAAGGSNVAQITSQFRTANFTIDTNGDGTGETLTATMLDTDTDGRYDALDLDVDDGGSYSGAELAIGSGGTTLINSNNFTFSVSLTGETGNATQNSFFDGLFATDQGEDGTPNEPLDFVLVDTDSDNVFTKMDLDLNDGASYAGDEIGIDSGDSVTIGSNEFNVTFATDGTSANLTSFFHNLFFTIDINGDGVAESNVTAVAVDTNSDNVFDQFNIDVNGSAAFEAGEEKADAATIDVNGNDFTVSLGSNGVTNTLTQTTHYDGGFIVDTDYGGSIEVDVDFVLIDSDSDNIFDRMDFDINNGGSYSNSGSIIEVDLRNTSTVLIGPNNFTVNFERDGSSASITQETSYEGNVVVDADQDGFTENITFALIDSDSDNIFDSTDIDSDADGAYTGSDVGVANNSQVSFNGVNMTFVALNTTPLTTEGNDVSFTINSWFNGTISIDADADGVADDTLAFALTDTDSDGVFNNLDLSLSDAGAAITYGEGATGDANVSLSNNDEKLTSGGDIPIGQYTFTVTPLNASNSSSMLNITMKTWYNGTFNGDFDADGSVDTAVLNFALSDIDSDGLFDRMDLSIDDTTHGEGTLTNQTAGVDGDDELISSAENVTIGNVQFEFAFIANPVDTGTEDANMTSTTWFTSGFTVDTDRDGVADDSVYFSLVDTDSDGQYETLDLSSDDNTFGEGTLTDGITGAGDDESLTSKTNVSIGGTYTFNVSFTALPQNDTNDANLTMITWVNEADSAQFTGLNTYDVALRDSNSNGEFDQVYIDGDDDVTFDEAADFNTLAVNASILIGNATTNVTINTIDNAGNNLTVAPTSGSVNGTSVFYFGSLSLVNSTNNAKSVNISIFDADGDGTFANVDIDLDEDGAFNGTGHQGIGEGVNITFNAASDNYQVITIADDGQTINVTDYTTAVVTQTNDVSIGGVFNRTTFLNAEVLVIDNATSGTADIIFVDTDKDGSLADETALATGTQFTMGGTTYEFDTLDTAGNAVAIQQTSNALVSNTTNTTGGYSVSISTDNNVWIETAASGYVTLNDTNSTVSYLLTDDSSQSGVDQALTIAVNGSGSSGSRIRGMVVEEANDTALNDVLVEIVDSSDNVIASTITINNITHNGSYSIGVADANGYKVHFHSSGYVNATPIDGVNLSAGGGDDFNASNHSMLYTLKVLTFDELGNQLNATSITHANISATTDNVTNAQHTFYFAATGNGALAAAKPGYVALNTSVDTGLIDVKTNESDQSVITLSGTTAFTSTHLPGQDVTGSGLAFSIKATRVANELNDTFTPDGTNASGSVTVSSIETVYSGGDAYIPATADSNTVNASRDGYVQTLATVTAGNDTQRTVEFTPDNEGTTVDAPGMQFGLKVTVLDELGTAITSLDSTDFRARAARNSSDNAFYFNDTTNSAATLRLNKTGYVSYNETNPGQITPNPINQTVITLDGSACTTGLTMNTSCAGMLFTLKATVQDVLGRDDITDATITIESGSSSTSTVNNQSSNVYYMALNETKFSTANITVGATGYKTEQFTTTGSELTIDRVTQETITPKLSVSTDTEAPSIVTLDSPADDSTTDDLTPDFQWSETTDDTAVDSYIFQLANVSNFSSVNLEKVLNSTQFNFTLVDNLTDGKTYFWKVRANDTSGNDGSWSTIYKFTTNTSASLTVQLLTSDNIGNNTDSYSDGWEFKFSIDLRGGDNAVRVKFANWTSGSNELAVFNNSRLSTACGVAPFYEVKNDYDTGQLAINLTDDDSGKAGIQDEVCMQVKIPTATAVGSYNTTGNFNSYST